MHSVDSLLKETRSVLAPVEEKILAHPYLSALESGAIAKESLSAFACEQYHIISSDLRSIAMLVAIAPTPAARDFFSFVLPGEQAALDRLMILAGALGFDESELDAYRPAAEAQAYKAFMAWLAMQGTPAQVATSFLVNFPAWGKNCDRMGAALKANYGFSKEEVGFFDLFAAPAPEFGNKAEAVIAEGLERGDDPEKIVAAACLLQEYELMFWDAIHKMAVGS